MYHGRHMVDMCTIFPDSADAVVKHEC